MNNLIQILFLEREDVAEDADGNRLVVAFQILDRAGAVDEVVLDGQAAVEEESGDAGPDRSEEYGQAVIAPFGGLQLVVDPLVDDGHDGILVGLLVRAGHNGYGA